MSETYIPFEEALEHLGISGQELKKMIDEGKIRSFKDGSRIKFRLDDIEKLAGKKPAAEKGDETAEEIEKVPESPGKPPASAGDEALESIFGDTDDFDIAPLEEDDLLSDAETATAPEEKPEAPAKTAGDTEEVQAVIEEEEPEEVETIEEAEEVKPEAGELQPVEEIEELEEVSAEAAPIEEIEELGEELSAAEIKSLAPRPSIHAVKPVSIFATTGLIIAAVLLIFATFLIVNSYARPDQPYSLFKPLSDFVINLSK